MPNYLGGEGRAVEVPAPGSFTTDSEDAPIRLVRPVLPPPRFPDIPPPVFIPPSGAAPAVPSAVAASPQPAPVPAGAGPYDAFNAAFRAAYGRPITQNELNDNKQLLDLGISNELFRLLPLDRQMGFPSDRLGKLDNLDLQRLIDFNPQVAGGFPTRFWQRFSNDWLAQTVVPFFQKANPTEAQNIIRQNSIGGVGAGALPVEQRPPLAPAPGGGPPSVQGPSPALTGGTLPIPRVVNPQLSSDLLNRGVLDQYLQLAGLGDFGAPTAPAGPALAGARRRLSGVAAPYPYAGNFPLTSGVGATDSNLRTLPHSGNDYAFPNGTPVPAAYPGVVRSAGNAGDFGLTVTIDHPELGTSTSYSHLSAINVQPGQQVGAGAVVGKSGATGVTEGPHLHYEQNPIGNGPGYRGPDIPPPNPPNPPPPGPPPPPPADPNYRQVTLPDGSIVTEHRQVYADGQSAWVPVGAPYHARAPQIGPYYDARTGYYDARTSDLLAKAQSDLYSAEAAYQRARAGHDQAATEQARADLAEKQRQFDLAHAQSGAQFQATLPVQVARETGYLGGEPTLAREQGAAQQDVANNRFLAERAYQAAQVALSTGNQAEARRQFDIAQGFKQALETAQFQRDVQRDPASFLYKAFAGRGQAPPAASPAAGTSTLGPPIERPAPGSFVPEQTLSVLAGSAPQVPGPPLRALNLASPSPSGSFSPSPPALTAPAPLTYQQAVGANPYAPPALKTVFSSDQRLGSPAGPPGGFAPISAQDYGDLTDNERQALASAVTATGEDFNTYLRRSRNLSSGNFGQPLYAAPTKI